MLKIGEHEITRIEIKDSTGVIRAISYIKYLGRVVWEAIRSCFGSGSWINNKPWINNEPWKN